MNTSLLQIARDLRAAVAARDWKTASDKLIEFQREAFGSLFGRPAGAAAAPVLAGADRAAIEAEMQAIVAECQTAPPAEAGAARGDGRFLELLTTFLPLLLKLL